jgi:hypothetical protein
MVYRHLLGGTYLTFLEAHVSENLTISYGPSPQKSTHMPVGLGRYFPGVYNPSEALPLASP